MRTFLIVVAALVLVACGSEDESVSTDGTSTTTSIGPVEYRSVSVTVGGEAYPLVEGTQISLRLGAATIGAGLGCNNLGADYHLVGDVVVVDAVSMTEMGCDAPRHAQDEWFVDFLGAAPTMTVGAGTLTLATADTTIEFLERSIVDPDRPLIGTAWTVDGFLDGTAAMSAAVDRPGSIHFDAATSTAEGFDGCNAFSVPFEVDGDDVRFGEVVADDAFCPAAADYVDRFHTVLVERVAFAIDADRLRLLAPDGRGVTFVAG